MKNEQTDIYEMCNYSTSNWFMDLDAPVDKKPIRQDFFSVPVLVTSSERIFTSSENFDEFVKISRSYCAPKNLRSSFADEEIIFIQNHAKSQKKSIFSRLTKNPIITKLIGFFRRKEVTIINLY